MKSVQSGQRCRFSRWSWPPISKGRSLLRFPIGTTAQISPGGVVLQGKYESAVPASTEGTRWLNSSGTLSLSNEMTGHFILQSSAPLGEGKKKSVSGWQEGWYLGAAFPKCSQHCGPHFVKKKKKTKQKPHTKKPNPNRPPFVRFVHHFSPVERVGLFWAAPPTRNVHVFWRSCCSDFSEIASRYT